MDFFLQSLCTVHLCSIQKWRFRNLEITAGNIHSERSRRIRNKTEKTEQSQLKETTQVTNRTQNNYCSVQFVIYPEQIGKFLFLVTVIKLVRDAKLSGNVNHSIHHIINQSKKKEIRRL